MEQVESRLNRLRRTMAASEVDFVALGPGAHMRWLLGFIPHPDERPCFVCVGPESAMMLMPALGEEASREHTDLPMVCWSDDEGPEGAFRRLVGAMKAEGARRIALDETMRADFAALAADSLPGAERVFTPSTVGALRMRKDDRELDVLKRSAIFADEAMKAGWARMAQGGAKEADIAEAVQEAFRRRGARPLFAIVGAGRNGAFPHHATGETEIRSGQPVVMDIGADHEGYSSDITRIALVGDPPDGYTEVHAVVEEAVQAALAAAKPGVAAREVDRAARSVIAKAGYGEFFVHRTGHGLGVETHEPPYITATSETVLEERMVFSIEPGIYLPGRFGIRLEEIVILRADGPEILSELPRDLARP